MNLLSRAALPALATVTLLAWAALVALWLSPYLVAHRLQAAVEARDADTVIDYIDLPRLREAARGSLHQTGGNPVAAALAEALFGPLLDALLREKTLRRFLSNPQADYAGLTWQTDYRGTHTFAIVLSRPGNLTVSVVLERWLWRWRIVRVELPDVSEPAGSRAPAPRTAPRSAEPASAG